MRFAEVTRLLEKAGFIHISTNGSHYKFKHPSGRWTIVPNHGSKDIKKWTLKAIEKQSGIRFTE